VIDDRNAGGFVPVAAPLLTHVGFTDHALARFASRAGLAVSRRSVIEPIVRDLLLLEGRVVTERPRWARSHNVADLYLQLGDWMLFIGCREASPGPQRYAIVTALAGAAGTTWQVALKRGYVRTPAPPPLTRGRPPRVSLIGSVLTAIRARSAGDRHKPLTGAVRTTHRTRQQRALAEYEREIATAWRLTSQTAADLSTRSV
jgi:hypothetical protein